MIETCATFSLITLNPCLSLAETKTSLLATFTSAQNDRLKVFIQFMTDFNIYH